MSERFDALHPSLHEQGAEYKKAAAYTDEEITAANVLDRVISAELVSGIYPRIRQLLEEKVPNYSEIYAQEAWRLDSLGIYFSGINHDFETGEEYPFSIQVRRNSVGADRFVVKYGGLPTTFTVDPRLGIVEPPLSGPMDASDAADLGELVVDLFHPRVSISYQSGGQAPSEGLKRLFSLG